MTKLVYGVGINDHKCPASMQGKPTREYNLWNNLLKRCYNFEYQTFYPTYLACLVSENFKSYSYFHTWCQNQIGFGQKGFQLDKDLLLKGNKLYSENTCVFIPNQLNSLLISRKTCRGSLPLGVSYQGGKFKVQCNSESTARHVGYFNTVNEAFQAYKQVKEGYIKRQAEKWKAHIDPRAYGALIAYEISISD